ncbi:uncharacterized protein PITG_11302 [Phytophthora infestans T30-4]|uniref:Uncharacterized protein n=1 Tax=Phytophthora infestans (strain T30-4) TaxID=403677 RepID=D0NGP9_PHYIT|nr:uncharacterized protein PITG_11302 [Phytophthora infestans T30-4]EEY57450.1 hypothetical protein PITG_11302 [Phytophthora infestans T30-4]|eukprot:XP_002902060.1 hypothetical protein PITG_11302 [Phytophthora infestans T30-4]
MARSQDWSCLIIIVDPVQLVPYVAGIVVGTVASSCDLRVTGLGRIFHGQTTKHAEWPRKQRKERARRHSFIPPSGYKRFNGQTKARIWTTARQRVTTSSSSR